MAEIPLTQGKLAIVDDADAQWLSRFRWHAVRIYKTYYAATTDPAARKRIYLHRAIMRPSEGLEVDHINGNGLDNRRENLRICSHRDNLCNQRRQEGRDSLYRGVTLDKRAIKQVHPWLAQIKAHGQHYNLGRFATQESAALAYNNAARRFHGEFAQLNEVPDDQA